MDYAAFAENHRFQIPEGAHWSDVRATTHERRRRRSRRPCAPSRRPTPTSSTASSATRQWTNKERLPDETLRDLIEHFSTLTLSVANVPEDELGNAYEYLIKKFADDSGHTAAEFYTNRTARPPDDADARPAARRVDLRPDLRHRRHAALGARPSSSARARSSATLKLYGQERNLMTSAIARMNLFLHGIEDFHIVRGDTLADPKFLEGDRLRQFDVVLANPPYSIKQWDRDGVGSPTRMAATSTACRRRAAPTTPSSSTSSPA